MVSMTRPIFSFAAVLLTLTAGAALAQPLNLSAPQGFKVQPYAQGFERPRFMVQGPNGDVFLSDTSAGKVYLLPASNPSKPIVYAQNLNQPHGLALHGGYLYVANTDSVVRFAYRSGDQSGKNPQQLMKLPTGGHFTRTVTFDEAGKMYVSVGSSCNVCEEGDKRRAAVWVYDADGKNGRPYATGLRNAVGLAWLDGTLYATSNGRDNLGDNIPPEGFYRLKSGNFYGWPYCYTTQAGKPQVWDKDFGRKDARTCAAATPAFATTTAHSAPLGIAAYTGKMFPGVYQGKLIAALHGSWNRSQKSGYKLVTVDPKTGQVSDFITGFLSGQRTLGRPAGVLTLADGSVLFSDDQGGIVYRVTYGQ